jgi:hypothetical protein
MPRAQICPKWPSRWPSAKAPTHARALLINRRLPTVRAMATTRAITAPHTPAQSEQVRAMAPKRATTLPVRSAQARAMWPTRANAPVRSAIARAMAASRATSLSVRSTQVRATPPTRATTLPGRSAQARATPPTHATWLAARSATTRAIRTAQRAGEEWGTPFRSAIVRAMTACPGHALRRHQRLRLRTHRRQRHFPSAPALPHATSLPVRSAQARAMATTRATLPWVRSATARAIATQRATSLEMRLAGSAITRAIRRQQRVGEDMGISSRSAIVSAMTARPRHALRQRLRRQ